MKITGQHNKYGFHKLPPITVTEKDDKLYDKRGCTVGIKINGKWLNPTLHAFGYVAELEVER